MKYLMQILLGLILLQLLQSCDYSKSGEIGASPPTWRR